MNNEKRSPNAAINVLETFFSLDRWNFADRNLWVCAHGEGGETKERCYEEETLRIFSFADNCKADALADAC